MENKKISLKEISIKDLFFKENNIYEIPIYQRNYAWEKDEINVFIQDVYDYFKKNNKYYIGTLVSYNKGNNVYEIIDGQQRLTTIRLILDALEVKKDEYKSYLTYRARNKSDETLKSIPDFNISNIDSGIRNGFKYAEASINEIVGNDEERLNFLEFFKSNVHIIHYQVPENIDLNHYFEIMNSRGEQLEQHEIVKARLMEVLQDEDDREIFNRIWECCSEMSIYVQKNFDILLKKKVFGEDLNEFMLGNFYKLKDELKDRNEHNLVDNNPKSITEILKMREKKLDEKYEKKDSFLPIVDFSNFLLIVLKITLMNEVSLKECVLDDKELLKMFENAMINQKDEKCKFVKTFAYNLLKARYFLDNYVVHHTMDDEKIGRNPWKLQVWNINSEPSNLSPNGDLQDRLVHLLSMFEVTYYAKQRKNYLFYCLLYLMGKKEVDIGKYANFLENLADIYFHEVYLSDKTFDDAVLDGDKLREDVLPKDNHPKKENNDKNKISNENGIPLFIFNYLDYKLWKLYAGKLRGKSKNDDERKDFFDKIGCDDLGLEVFDNFYFSRTRNSLEHYYPRANENDVVSKEVIECFGNYAMIGSEANSSGSNWSPKEKMNRYLDSSGKIDLVSVSSLKFRIMMQICCNQRGVWEKTQIEAHQGKMIKVLFTD